MVNVSNVNTQHTEVINLVWRVCRIDGRVTNVEENNKKKFPRRMCYQSPIFNGEGGKVGGGRSLSL